MKKEKKIKAHTRRTKSGKTITVKAHTAKYDAAEELKKAAKKKGAGDEFENRKKEKFMVLGVDLSAFSDEELKELDFIEYDDNGKAVHAPKTRSGLKRFAEKYYSDPDSADAFREGMADFYAEVKERRKAKKSSEAKVPKSSKGETPSLKSNPTKKNSYEQYGFTKEEFAEWYEGTGSKADKKVEKALRKVMGSKAYNDLSDSAADNYKDGGADSFFKKGIKKMQATTKNGTSKVELNELTYYGWELIPKRVEESAKAKTSTSSKSASKKLKTQKTLNDYSDEDLDYAHKKDIKKVAKVLGLTDVEAASWVIGPNFTEYKQSHMNKGEKKAKKYLGKEIFDRLDPSSPDSFRAVLDKARGKKL